MTAVSDTLRRRLDLLDRDRLKTLDALALVEAFGEDEYEVGTVVAFEKYFERSGRAYSYAAIKSPDGYWYTTGPVGQSSLVRGRPSWQARAHTWEEFIGWLTSGPKPTTELWLVTEYEAIHDPGR